MSDSPSYPTLTYDIISTTIKRESEVTYSYYWKVKEIRTYQVTTQKTYLRSNNELLGQNQHKRVVAILIKKTRQNLDTGSPSPLNSSIRENLEETASLAIPHQLIEEPSSDLSDSVN
ncbi:hypothetical protein PGTUg99_015192 [Puccinia graminis f. sp. tritici]|uniref:Uncharacterized protein n=1 Tax=Puccinia graminis f. sp. tritici TaxID=56615 RepID=A0A5B0QL64_PUCGR|nr:hypothetical protein PGTUg99_015192 [Puccinia graminis f. sp. tritici]